MRIVFLADQSIIHTVRFTNYFASRGHDVHLITFEEGYPVNCEVHKITPGPGPKLISYLMRRSQVRDWLGNLKPDIVDTQQVSSYGNLMATINYHPWVATALGSDILIVPQKGLLSRTRIVWALQKADLITAMSPFMRDCITALGLPASKIVVSCFGIDPAIFNPRGRKEHQAGKPWHLICTRNLEPVYDHRSILAACQELSKRGVDYYLTLVGKGSLMEELQRASHHSDLVGRINFKGNLTQPQVAEELRQADIFITASHSDGANISLLEAMACGTFPIASDIPADSQWGEDGKSMLFFPPGDTTKLSSAIQFAVEHAELVRSAQSINYQTVAERGTLGKNMGVLETSFLELIQVTKKGTGE